MQETRFVIGVSDWGDDELDIPLRELLLQTFHDRGRRVRRVRHAKEQLEFRVFLPTEAGEILVGLRVQPSDRLEDGYRRGEALI